MMMRHKLSFLLLCGSALLSASAGAHTFGVGLRAADSGSGVEVHYRAWHSCEEPFFEGEIKIEGIDGTNYGPVSSTATLSSCNEPDGISTFPEFEPTNIGYYCEVDALGNIINAEDNSINTTAAPSFGYDPSSPKTLAEMNETEFGSPDAVGAILCNEPVYNYEDNSPEDMWQGAVFDNLPSGRYLVTYVPCDADGDPSDCADGQEASDTWDPDKNLVLNAEIIVRTATGIPTMPFYGLFVLAGLLALLGLSRLQSS